MGLKPHSKTGLKVRNWVGISQTFPPALHPEEENIPDENVPLPPGFTWVSENS